MPESKRSNKPNPAKLKEQFGYVKVVAIGHYLSPWLIAGITKQGRLEIFNCNGMSPTICLEPEQVEALVGALVKK
jgi:hypothetical protein